MRHRTALAAIAICAVVTYLPILQFPFISDDFAQIPLSRVYGPPSGWGSLLQDAAFRYRFTYIELQYVLDRLFGFTPLPFYIASAVLHVLCSWLVYATGGWERIGYGVAFPAAVFFAVYEGHQEAVMWVAASMELFQFAFGVGAFLLWLRWMETRSGWAWLGSVGSFALALASKESAVVIPGLLAIPVLMQRSDWKRTLAALVPFGLLAAAVAWTAIGGKNERLHDGSFSFQAPFVRVFLNSFWRLFWIWGLVATAILLVRRRAHVLWPAIAWATVALAPYVFLLYMPRVPSRHTYLASLGVSWIVGAAWCAVEKRRIAMVLAAVVLLHNGGTIWTKKRRQFLERAEPTEKLIRLVRSAAAPVRVHCFPYNIVIARTAAESAGKKIVEEPWPSCRAEDFAVTVDGHVFR